VKKKTRRGSKLFKILALVFLVAALLWFFRSDLANLGKSAQRRFWTEKTSRPVQRRIPVRKASKPVQKRSRGRNVSKADQEKILELERKKLDEIFKQR
jgi:hypothetical protein